METSSLRSSRKTNYNKELLPPDRIRRIIHSVKAAIASNPEDTTVLLSDISNAYNERARAKMLKLLYARKELKHLWRCADIWCTRRDQQRWSPALTASE
jgi:hypothetical protein